ncbi:S8 family peptidase [Clostridium sp. FP1]|uniref:S8 family peptidase n=1 Tax=Clostridium sp. FP1 TaxID=2724076 RepID=UPI0013E92528|nr:S8 family serine peptidase [Clostridium sp. FP1]MBZ9637407.1 S8 family serine peptidase [Clostridium sp. FP1]
MKNFILKNKKTVYDLMNDTHKELLWGLRLINIEDTWENITQEELSKVKVAIVDSGIDSEHEDLRNMVHKGYNFIDNTTNTQDNFGHGTRIAGIIGAERNNGIGIAGVASGVKLIPLKVIDGRGRGDIKNVVRALEWCIENQVDIINLSIGYQRNEIDILTNKNSIYYYKEQELIERALKNNITVVSSVGNGYGKAMQYPAAYPGVISVASCGICSKPFTLYCATKNNKCNGNTIYAPGEYIFTTDVGNKYSYDFGSSMACGFITGAVSLLKAKRIKLTSTQIHLMLLENANTIEIGNKSIKFLNVDKAFNALKTI